MRTKNSKGILDHCLKFNKKVFGVGFKPDFYNRFDWVEDERLNQFIKRYGFEVGLVRLGGDVGLHRDKDVSRKVKMIVLKDFWFEINGKKGLLNEGDIIDFDGGLLHQGWNCWCLVMWNRKGYQKNNQICLDL